MKNHETKNHDIYLNRFFLPPQPVKALLNQPTNNNPQLPSIQFLEGCLPRLPKIKWRQSSQVILFLKLYKVNDPKLRVTGTEAAVKAKTWDK